MGDRTCSEPQCQLDAKVRGFCNTHYGKRWRSGTLPIAQKPNVHALTDVDAEAKTARCSVCGPVSNIRPPRHRHGAECPIKRRSQRKIHKKTGTAYGHSRRPGGVGYRLTRAERLSLVEAQRGRCAICSRTEAELGEQLCVDHCHDTGRVRGLLCRSCNLGIGYLKDNSERVWQAFAYLVRT